MGPKIRSGKHVIETLGLSSVSTDEISRCDGPGWGSYGSAKMYAHKSRACGQRAASTNSCRSARPCRATAGPRDAPWVSWAGWTGIDPHKVHGPAPSPPRRPSWPPRFCRRGRRSSPSGRRSSGRWPIGWWRRRSGTTRVGLVQPPLSGAARLRQPCGFSLGRAGRHRGQQDRQVQDLLPGHIGTRAPTRRVVIRSAARACIDHSLVHPLRGSSV